MWETAKQPRALKPSPLLRCHILVSCSEDLRSTSLVRCHVRTSPTAWDFCCLGCNDIKLSPVCLCMSLSRFCDRDDTAVPVPAVHAAADSKIGARRAIGAVPRPQGTSYAFPAEPPAVLTRSSDPSDCNKAVLWRSMRLVHYLECQGSTHSTEHLVSVAVKALHQPADAMSAHHESVACPFISVHVTCRRRSPPKRELAGGL